jgi:hypothetical protein
MKNETIRIFVLSVALFVMSQTVIFNLAEVQAAPSVTAPIKYGAVYDTCIRFHKKEVLQSCNYLCLYDKPCRDQCIETSEEAVLDKECGKYAKNKK